MDLLKYLIVPYGNIPLTTPSERNEGTSPPILDPAGIKEGMGNLTSYLPLATHAPPKPESHHLQESFRTAHEHDPHPHRASSHFSGRSSLPSVEITSPPRYVLSKSVVHQGRRDSFGSASKADAPAATATTQNTPKTVCHYWYHRGMCSRDPASPNYINSGKACRFLHQINDGMAVFTVQRVPAYMHKQPCGLERCSQRDGRPWVERPTKALAPQAVSSSNTGTRGVANTKKRRLEEIGQAGNKTPTQPSSMAATQQAHRHDRPTNPALSLPTKPSRKNANKKRKRQQARAPTGPSKPPARRSTANETCFFWYHRTCQRGIQCNMLHALTDPPTLVQPPPGLVHFQGPCELKLCPRDYKWAEKEEPQVKRRQLDDGHKSRIAKLANLAKSETKAVVGGDSPEEGEVNEEGAAWFLKGFPDAP